MIAINDSSQSRGCRFCCCFSYFPPSRLYNAIISTALHRPRGTGITWELWPATNVHLIITIVYCPFDLFTIRHFFLSRSRAVLWSHLLRDEWTQDHGHGRTHRRAGRDGWCWRWCCCGLSLLFFAHQTPTFSINVRATETTHSGKCVIIIDTREKLWNRKLLLVSPRVCAAVRCAVVGSYTYLPV